MGVFPSVCLSYPTRALNMFADYPSRPWRLSLYTGVPLAYVSMILWRPAEAYTKYGRAGVDPIVLVLMILVFVVCLRCWVWFRALSLLGLAAFFLWLCITLAPVL